MYTEAQEPGVPNNLKLTCPADLDAIDTSYNDLVTAIATQELAK